MDPAETYEWEIMTTEGVRYSQYNKDGTENSFPEVSPGEVSKLQYNPRIDGPAPHIMVFSKDLKFVRRFGRGFITINNGRQSKQYAFCTVTNKFRLYLLPDGRIIVTHKDYELRRL